MKITRMEESLQRLNQYRPLLNELVVRDLKIKYRRSFLGYLWSLLNPLMMMTVMTIVFSYMFRFDIPNYPLYLICGQTLWSFFNESTNTAMHSVLANGQLIRKVYIPKYIFPVSRVLSSFVTMSFSLAAVLIVMLVTRVHLTWNFLLVPIPLVLLLLFCTGVGMVLSALAVYFRDILHLYSVVVLAWMYATPIFYPVSALPEKVAFLLLFNPMYHYVTFFRDVVLNGAVPSATIWVGSFGFSALAIGAGLLIFRKLQRNFILYV